MALALGYLGLCLVAPLLLARLKSRRIALASLAALGAALAWHAASRFAEARGVDRALAQRVHYPLPQEDAGRRSLVIEPLPDVEGIHVSVVDAPAGLTAERLRRASWGLAGGGRPDWSRTFWFDDARLQPDDEGLPLFETGDGPLENAVVLSFEAETWMGRARLRVRPDWFSLKMLPIVAGVLRLQGGAAAAGVLLCLGLILRRARRSRQPAAPPTGT